MKIVDDSVKNIDHLFEKLIHDASGLTTHSILKGGFFAIRKIAILLLKHCNGCMRGNQGILTIKNSF
jgi:hypothetical protein